MVSLFNTSTTPRFKPSTIIPTVWLFPLKNGEFGPKCHKREFAKLHQLGAQSTRLWQVYISLHNSLQIIKRFDSRLPRLNCGAQPHGEAPPMTTFPKQVFISQTVQPNTIEVPRKVAKVVVPFMGKISTARFLCTIFFLLFVSRCSFCVLASRCRRPAKDDP